MSDEKTIFKKIIDGEIPADVIYEDELCLAFNDVSPQAPTHVLLIPKKEIATLNDASDEDQQLLGHLMLTLTRIAKQLGLEHYRVAVNCGAGAGQSVFHLHLHLLGGRDAMAAGIAGNDSSSLNALVTTWREGVTQSPKENKATRELLRQA